VTRPGRYRLRRPAVVPLALAGLLVTEVAAVVAVGRQLGVLPTVLLLLAGLVLGGWLLRREGTRAWRAFAAAVTEGRPPHREALDGVLVLLGGLLVLFPGFVSDVLGLLCLLPPTRAAVRRGLGRYLAGRSAARVVRVRARRGPQVDPAAGEPRSQPAPGERVIDGELAGPDEPTGDGPGRQ
jgi:UPF0716 protein FxsA